MCKIWHTLEKVYFRREKNPSKEGKFFIQRDLMDRGESKKLGNLGVFYRIEPEKEVKLSSKLNFGNRE
jgi:hypothetical protein